MSSITDNSDDNSERKQLRKKLRDTRLALTETEHADHGNQLFKNFLASPFSQFIGPIASYWASDGEIDTAPLNNYLLEQSRSLCLPRVIDATQMQFHRYENDVALVTNRYGIPEPTAAAERFSGTQLRVLLLPLVGFDNQGNRLGMGGGYYDRFLGRLAPSVRPLMIGLAHECQRCNTQTPEDWDIPLDGVITESQWHWFKRH